MGEPTSKPVPPSKPVAPRITGIARPIIAQPRPMEVASPRPPARPVNRSVIIDGTPINVTGFYEHVPAKPGENSAFTLQLNQAGEVVVGWFSEVHRIVANLSPVRTVKQLKPLERVGHGVLYATLIDPKKGSQNLCFVGFSWSRRTAKADEINELDPLDASGANDRGLLRLEPEQPPDIILPQTLSLFPKFPLPEPRRWVVTGVNFSGSQADGFEPVRLVRPRPRLSYNLMQQQGELLRDALIATHISILPESFVESLLRRVTRIFRFGPFGLENDLPPSTESDLDRWIAATNEWEKKAPRQSIVSVLASFHTDITRLPYKLQQEQLRDAFIANAQSSMKSVGDKNVSYFRLYMQLMAEEIENASTSETTTLKPIIDLGTFPAVSQKTQRYRYRLEFKPLPFIGDKLKLSLGPLALAGGFTLSEPSVIWWNSKSRPMEP